MKKTIILIITISICLACKAQIIALEDYDTYMQSHGEIPAGAYLKDVNNRLDKFVGTWQGTKDNKTYTFYIVKDIRYYLNISEDLLYVKYKIVDNSSSLIIKDITNLPNSNSLVIKGYQFQYETYTLTYNGDEANCGQEGVIYLTMLNPNHTSMELFLVESGEILETACPNGLAQQIIPTVDDSIILTKQ